MAGTSKRQAEFDLDCDNLPDICKWKRALLETEEPRPGMFMPMCDDDGSYMAEQCHSSTGQCFCVDRVTGKEVEGSRALSSEFDLDCSDLPKNFGKCRKKFKKRCHSKAKCQKRLDSYECVCNAGYTGDGFTCTGPTDPCQTKYSRPCHSKAKCQKQGRDHVCKCEPGYAGNGFKCQELSICHRTFGTPCSLDATCQMIGPVPQCVCKTGFSGSGFDCRKIDDCRIKFGRPCDSKALCGKDKDGNPVCRCQQGYLGTGLKCSLDTRDPCEKQNKKPCSKHATCQKDGESYRCVCKEGYMMDLSGCSPIPKCPGVKLYRKCATNCPPNCDDILPRCNRACSTTNHCVCPKGMVERSSTDKTCVSMRSCLDKYKPGTCSHEVAKTMSDIEIDDLQDAFVPQCDLKGNYRKRQCYGFTGMCYCVNMINGKIMAGTSKRQAEFDLDCDNLPDICKWKRALLETEDPRPGMFMPMCDDDGSYMAEQCHSSTGQCFCVDRVTGEEVEGSRAMLSEFDLDCKNLPENFGRCRKLFKKPCHSKAKCRKQGESYECVCNIGYTGDGFSCTDEASKSPCETDSGKRCHKDATCMKDGEKYKCKCNKGFTGDGNMCSVDERDPCEKEFSKKCHSDAKCIKDKDKYKCKCRKGYSGDGFKCSENRGRCYKQFKRRCSKNAYCMYMEDGSYKCQCKEEYFGNGFWCGSGTPRSSCHREFGRGCSVDADCTTVDGRPRCRCKTGFFGNGFFCGSGEPKSECHRRVGKVCGKKARCNRRRDGEYECMCMDGYAGDGYECEDMKARCFRKHKRRCSKNAKCMEDDEGSYQCKCKDGYFGNGFWCASGTAKSNCHKRYGRPCSENAMCDSVDGSYKCKCKSGFFGNGFHCSSGEPKSNCHRRFGKVCGKNAKCDMGQGGEYECMCMDGYMGDGWDCEETRGRCYKQLGRRCSKNAFCKGSNDGSYRCKCKAGYFGNGFWCGSGTPKTNCHRRLGRTCSENARCFTSDEGISQCRCKADYFGDGLYCDTGEPKSKCHRRFGRVCAADAKCKNTVDGQPECRCDEGFTGDGFECEETREPCMRDDGTGCDENAECSSDGYGSQKCVCRTGYFGDGYKCREVDNCYALSSQPCHHEADCVNEEGGYKCVCKDGYKGNGFYCQATGCSRPENIANGRILSSQTRFTTNNVISYQCDQGFMMEGNAQRSCKEDGKWSGTSPSCRTASTTAPEVTSKKVDHCQRPRDINQGKIEENQGLFNTNDMVNYVCQEGYLLRGNKQRRCQENGEWSGRDPRCQREDDCYRRNRRFCSEFANCMNLEGTYSCQCRGGYKGDGYNCEVEEKDESGKGQCKRPRDIENGRILSDHEMYSTFNVISYQCDEGFSLIGDSQRTCQDDGQWSGSTPRCQKHNECHKLRNQPCHGKASCVFDGTGFVCQCWSGYEGDGYNCLPADVTKPTQSTRSQTKPTRTPQRTVTQTPHSKSTKSPQLKEKKCSKPVGIDKGSFTPRQKEYSIGSTITYECQKGARMQGNSRQSCKNDGTWTGSAPRCQIQRCNRPPNIPNGYLEHGGKTSFNPGEMIKYRCNKGYRRTPKGTRGRRTCQDGSWSGKPYRCVAV